MPLHFHSKHAVMDYSSLYIVSFRELIASNGICCSDGKGSLSANLLYVTYTAAPVMIVAIPTSQGDVVVCLGSVLFLDGVSIQLTFAAEARFRGTGGSAFSTSLSEESLDTFLTAVIERMVIEKEPSWVPKKLCVVSNYEIRDSVFIHTFSS